MLNMYTMTLANGDLIRIKAIHNKDAIKSALQYGKVRIVRDDNNKLVYLNMGVLV